MTKFTGITITQDDRIYRNHCALVRNGEIVRAVRIDELDSWTDPFDTILVHPDTFAKIKAKLDE